MHAIPTMYKGVQFRSRLEARYAAWFQIQQEGDSMARPDECGRPYPEHWRFKWVYEPLDFAGWIPDFLVQHAGIQILVEVKPALSLEELRPYTGKIDTATRAWLLPHTDEPLDKSPERWVCITGADPSIALRKTCCDPVWTKFGRRADDPDWLEAGNRVQWRKPS